MKRTGLGAIGLGRIGSDPSSSARRFNGKEREGYPGWGRVMNIFVEITSASPTMRVLGSGSTSTALTTLNPEILLSPRDRKALRLRRRHALSRCDRRGPDLVR